MTKRRTFLAFLLSAAIGLYLPLFAGQSYWPAAVGDFDGSSDYLLRGSDLAGNSDGKEGIITFSFRLDGGNGNSIYWLHNSGGRVNVFRNAANVIRITLENSSNDTVFTQATSTTHVSSTDFHFFMASWNLATAASHIFVDDVDVAAAAGVLDDDTIEYTRSTWAICAITNGTSTMDGVVSEFYFAPNQYLNFSVESNRRLFIDRAGFPVPLGVSGQLPTGTAPLVYMRTRANNAGINSGTGGDFAIQGAPLYSDGPFPFFPLTVPIPDRGMGSRIH